jgi:ubiquitin C-terminal hydrolase
MYTIRNSTHYLRANIVKPTSTLQFATLNITAKPLREVSRETIKSMRGNKVNTQIVKNKIRTIDPQKIIPSEDPQKIIPSYNSQNITTSIITSNDSQNITTSNDSQNITTSNTTSIITSNDSQNITTSNDSQNITTSNDSQNITTSNDLQNITTSNDSQNITTSNTTSIITSNDSQNITTSNDSQNITASNYIIEPKGLNNLGSTCYLNSVLQSLLSLDSFVEFFNSVHFTKNQRISLIMANFILSYKGSNGVCSPSDICLYVKCNEFRIGDRMQHDAEEALNCIIDKLIEEAEAEATQEVSSELIMSAHSLNSNKSCSLNDIIGGGLISEISCVQAHKSSVNENFIILSLSVVANTFEQCIKHFFDPEDISDTYKCENCSEKNSSSKKYLLAHSNPILIFHLKRFNNLRQKINTPVQIPHQLTINTTDENSSNKNYRLKALVIHQGGTAGGHYYAKINRGGSWYIANDSAIQPINETQVNDTDAYLLFYEHIQ